MLKHATLTAPSCPHRYKAANPTEAEGDTLGMAVPSEDWVALAFVPNNPFSMRSAKFSGRALLCRTVQQRTAHKEHQV